jgi:hypothetical protein
MACNRIHQRAIIALATGERAGVTGWWLRRHLQSCADCRRQLETTQAVIAGLHGMATTSPHPATRQRVLDHLQAETNLPHSAPLAVSGKK